MYYRSSWIKQQNQILDRYEFYKDTRQKKKFKYPVDVDSSDDEKNTKLRGPRIYPEKMPEFIDLYIKKLIDWRDKNKDSMIQLNDVKNLYTQTRHEINATRISRK